MCTAWLALHASTEGDAARSCQAAAACANAATASVADSSATAATGAGWSTCALSRREHVPTGSRVPRRAPRCVHSE
eukprot:scaffold119017_cov81-Phaeocystis_antarctica.AAC.5